MDFVDLQGIDYRAEMHCTCTRPCLDITLDGITISCQTSNLHMVVPWAAPADCEELQWGSKFNERLYVADHASRTRLLAFAASGVAGVKASDLEELVEGLCDLDRIALASIVEAAARQRTAPNDELYYECHGWAEDLLHSLGSSASACVLVRPKARHLLQHFVAHENCCWGSVEAEQQAHALLPMLWPLCLEASTRREMDEDDPDTDDAFPVLVCRFLSELSQVWQLKLSHYKHKHFEVYKESTVRLSVGMSPVLAVLSC
jgi:hypothetical protein